MVNANSIEVCDLHLSLVGNIAVDGISHVFNLAINTGIVGETGSGKSSLLKLMAGLEQADSGSVFYQGERVLGAGEKLIPGHPQIAYLSQHYELKNNYRIEEILSYYNLLDEKAANDIYSICEISHLTKRWSDELSGGEKQRVALAALISRQPKVLLLDEPFSNLDTLHKNKLLGLLDTLQKTTAVSYITVSHDIQDILSLSDEIAVMKNGKIIQSGTPQQLYRRPANEYCAGLTGGYQLFDEGSMLVQSIKIDQFPQGKRLLVRPGYFSVCEKIQSIPIGIVEKVMFYGTHSILKVTVGDESVTVSAISCDYVPGQEVSLNFNPQEICFL